MTVLLVLVEETAADSLAGTPTGVQAAVSSSTAEAAPVAEPGRSTRKEFAAELRRKERNRMASRLHTPPDPSAENLADRLARTCDLAGPRRPGDTFEQGGWQHHPTENEQLPLPSAARTLVPFLVLLIVAVALTVGLLLIAGHRGRPAAGWTWDDHPSAIGAQS